MIFDGMLAAPGHKDEFFNSRSGRFLYGILN